MIKLKTAEGELWKLAKELPYKLTKVSTTEKHFTPSYTFRQDDVFNITELKQVGAPTKN